MKKAFQTVGPYEKISFIPIAIAMAQCITVICEEEKIYDTFIEDLKTDVDYVGYDMTQIASLELTTITDQANAAAHQYLKSLIISIQSNFYFKSKKTSPVLHQTKVDLLAKLQDDIDRLFGDENCKKLNLLVGQLQEQMKQDMSSEMGNLNQMTSIYEQIKYAYLTKRNFLELLTNLLAPSDNDNEDDEGGEDALEDDDEDDETEAMDSCDGVNDTNSSAANCDPLLLAFCRKSNCLLKCLLTELTNKTLVDDEEGRQIFAKHIYGKEIINM